MTTLSAVSSPHKGGAPCVRTAPRPKEHEAKLFWMFLPTLLQKRTKHGYSSQFASHTWFTNAFKGFGVLELGTEPGRLRHPASKRELDSAGALRYVKLSKPTPRST